MNGDQSEYGLEFPLAFDGRIHHLEEGRWIKFEIEPLEATKRAAARAVLLVHAARAGWYAPTRLRYACTALAVAPSRF